MRKRLLLLTLSLMTVAGALHRLAAATDPVEVHLSEYAIEMPRTLPAGPMTFLVSNDGKNTHSFKIEGPGLAAMLAAPVRPRKTASLQVTLVPGDYKVYCPVGSHEAKGMTTTLTVTAK
jgi:hypothetical protein